MNLALSWFARFIARRSGPKLGKALPNTPKQLGEEGTRAITLPAQGYGPPDPPH
jgi:glutamate transport system permease protein